MKRCVQCGALMHITRKDEHRIQWDCDECDFVSVDVDLLLFNEMPNKEDDD